MLPGYQHDHIMLGGKHSSTSDDRLSNTHKTAR